MKGWVFSELNWTLGRNWAKRTLLLILSGAVISFFSFWLFSTLHFRLFWSPLQQAYYDAYKRSATDSPDELLVFRILLVDLPVSTGGIQSFFATDRDVKPVDDGRFELTEEGRRKGLRSVHWMTCPRVNAAELYWHLRDHIYDGKSPSDLFRIPRYATYLVFLCIIAVGLYLDRADIIHRRQVQHVRGPQILTVPEFNKVTHGEGIGIITSGAH